MRTEEDEVEVEEGVASEKTGAEGLVVEVRSLRSPQY